MALKSWLQVPVKFSFWCNWCALLNKCRKIRRRADLQWKIAQESEKTLLDSCALVSSLKRQMTMIILKGTNSWNNVEINTSRALDTLYLWPPFGIRRRDLISCILIRNHKCNIFPPPRNHNSRSRSPKGFENRLPLFKCRSSLNPQNFAMLWVLPSPATEKANEGGILTTNFYIPKDFLTRNDRRISLGVTST